MNRERMNWLTPEGEQFAKKHPEFLIEHILGSIQALGHRRGSHPTRDLKTYKVTLRTQEGQCVEGQSSGIRSKGLYVVTDILLPIGTVLEIELFRFGHQGEHPVLTGRGHIQWRCPLPDQFSNGRGLGIHCTEITASSRIPLVPGQDIMVTR